MNIRAVYDEKTIRVYQAYNSIIAEETIQIGTFGSSFKHDRMTWIKPSFLWMMYRSGWASKENQERILAIDLKRDAFDYLVNNAVPSAFAPNLYSSIDEWENSLKQSYIRVQWDPERDEYGNPLNVRSIQIGIKGDLVNKYVNEWIVQVSDITDYVHKLKSLLEKKEDISELLPKEKIYPELIIAMR